MRLYCRREYYRFGIVQSRKTVSSDIMGFRREGAICTNKEGSCVVRVCALSSAIPWGSGVCKIIFCDMWYCCTVRLFYGLGLSRFWQFRYMFGRHRYYHSNNISPLSYNIVSRLSDSSCFVPGGMMICITRTAKFTIECMSRIVLTRCLLRSLKNPG